MVRRNKFRLHPSHRFALLAAGPSRSMATGGHPFLNLSYSDSKEVFMCVRRQKKG